MHTRNELFLSPSHKAESFESFNGQMEIPGIENRRRPASKRDRSCDVRSHATRGKNRICPQAVGSAHRHKPQTTNALAPMNDSIYISGTNFDSTRRSWPSGVSTMATLPTRCRRLISTTPVRARVAALILTGTRLAIGELAKASNWSRHSRSMVRIRIVPGRPISTRLSIIHRTTKSAERIARANVRPSRPRNSAALGCLNPETSWPAFASLPSLAAAHSRGSISPKRSTWAVGSWLSRFRDQTVTNRRFCAPSAQSYRAGALRLR